MQRSFASMGIVRTQYWRCWFFALCGFIAVGTVGPLGLIESQGQASAFDDRGSPSGSSEGSSTHYERSVKPVLFERCVACHGALKQEAGLRLDTAKFAILGGDSGAAIQPSEPQRSLILDRVTSSDMAIRMPPEGEPLKAEQIKNLSKWIAEGAVAPQDEVAEKSPLEHWSFQPPVKPDVPAAPADIAVLAGTAANEPSAWAHPIDAFLERERQAMGLVAQPPVDRRLWLRRVSIDLIGLPPTLQEQKDFIQDESVEAYDRVVTRLLDSPQYGERWGRHWMDVWRYSDWWGLGAEVRNSQKHIWHWRDWIIESLNEDKGYDQMIREMLAADELYPNDLKKLRASGFLARQYFRFNRTSWLDETVEHTSKAIMGLTMNCSKCHDHKYDPISQHDYYQMRAIFEPYQIRIDFVPGETDPERNGVPRAFDCNLDEPTYVHVRGDDRNPDTSQKMAPSVPAFLLTAKTNLTHVPVPSFQAVSVPIPSEAHDPGSRSFVVDSYLNTIGRQIEGAVAKLSELEAKIATTVPVADSPSGSLSLQQERKVADKVVVALNANKQAILAKAHAQRLRHSDPDSELYLQSAREASRLERAAKFATAGQDLEKAQLDLVQLEETQAPAEKLEEVKKKIVGAQEARDGAQKAMETVSEQFTPLVGSIKTLESNLETEESRRKPYPVTSTGRRTGLVNWLTHPGNPLTARVAVNHMWTRHMGTPLVPTVFDFGRKGKPPTHPELLDWLAMELVEKRWSMKHLHRLIVTSKAYQMSSSSLHADEETVRKDPENRFYWRANAGRMESQTLRDSMLKLADSLDLTMGGPSIPAAEEKSVRRSLYYVHSHNEHNQFLSMFDDASVLDCYRRAQSIVPQQALALENSPLAFDCSKKIADLVASKMDPNDALDANDLYVRTAFHMVLASDPSSEEIAAAVRGMNRWIELASKTNTTNAQSLARVNLIQALINHNDFITIR